MHRTTEPPILYFGTPVVLISTENEDGSYNIGPMSSAFWLGWRCVLGLSAVSKSPENMWRTGEAVLNLPSDEMVAAVDRLARKTGSDPVPPVKDRRGYETERDKFGVAGLTPIPSETVRAPRIEECPVQMEAVVAATHDLAADDAEHRGRSKVIEVRIQRVHADERILMEGQENRIDPDRWRPLIMSFQHFYGLREGKLQDSRLARIPEHLYRTPDVDRARLATPVPRT
jgi:flavin reductase (DIM6/NTAB) family NADH-FMN oxidoreductase RutF